MSLRVNFLQFLRFHIQPMADDRRNHPAKRREDVLLKIHQRNQPKFRIPVIDAWNAVAHGLGLFFVLSSQDSNNCDMAVRRRKLFSIDVGKGERIIISDAQLDGLEGCDCRESNEEKTLPGARKGA